MATVSVGELDTNDGIQGNRQLHLYSLSDAGTQFSARTVINVSHDLVTAEQSVDVTLLIRRIDSNEVVYNQTSNFPLKDNNADSFVTWTGLGFPDLPKSSLIVGFYEYRVFAVVHGSPDIGTSSGPWTFQVVP